MSLLSRFFVIFLLFCFTERVCLDKLVSTSNKEKIRKYFSYANFEIFINIFLPMFLLEFINIWLFNVIKKKTKPNLHPGCTFCRISVYKFFNFKIIL